MYLTDDLQGRHTAGNQGHTPVPRWASSSSRSLHICGFYKTNSTLLESEPRTFLFTQQLSSLIHSKHNKSRAIFIRSHKHSYSATTCWFFFYHTAFAHCCEFGVQYLAQVHFRMQTIESRDRTTDYLVGWPTLPPELQPPHQCHLTQRKKTIWYNTIQKMARYQLLYWHWNIRITVSAAIIQNENVIKKM